MVFHRETDIGFTTTYINYLQEECFMDQIKIGKFIADMRKEQNLTQKQLADKLDISDRTISKWECGKGMPEVGLMLPLCEALNINVNELLAGEQISEEFYSDKAEENIIELIKENKKNKKQTLQYIFGYLTAIFVVLAVFFISVPDNDMIINYLDFPSAIVLFVVIILFLAATGLFKDFFRAFLLAFCESDSIEEEGTEKFKRAYNAVELAMKTSIYISVFTVLFYLVVLLQELYMPELIGPNIAVAVLSPLYGVFLSMILLPVRARLKVKIDELESMEEH